LSRYLQRDVPRQLVSSQQRWDLVRFGQSASLIEGNLVEDSWREGIFYEISTGATIRNNVVRRSNDTGILISTSKNVEVYGNTLEDHFRGIQLFLNCNAGGGGTLQYDLANNFVHDNSIEVGTKSVRGRTR
jgi:parallel beta-helix repeat protein